MDSKISTVGILWIVLGALSILCAVFMGVGGGSSFQAGSHASDGVMQVAVGSMMGIIAAVLLLLGLLEIFAGMALRKHRPWGRTTIIILSIVNLVGFPIGTIIGIYSLVVLLKAGAKPLFAT